MVLPLAVLQFLDWSSHSLPSLSASASSSVMAELVLGPRLHSLHHCSRHRRPRVDRTLVVLEHLLALEAGDVDAAGEPITEAIRHELRMVPRDVPALHAPPHDGQEPVRLDVHPRQCTRPLPLHQITQAIQLTEARRDRALTGRCQRACSGTAWRDGRRGRASRRRASGCTHGGTCTGCGWESRDSCQDGLAYG